MSITYEIDRSLKTVFVRANGVLTPQDLFSYQEEVWQKPEFRGFHECVDLSGVSAVVDATDKNMKSLAEQSVQTDDPATPTKLAIIARDDLHFGLGRMYEAYRSMQPKNTRHVAVFRTREEALKWLSGETTAP